MAETTRKMIWVNSAKVDCVGVAPMQCYQVKEQESGPWSNLYQDIQGFDFQPGYVYQLEVEVEELPQDEVPADSSTLEYRLIRVVDKAADPLLLLQDIWIATHIEGERLAPKDGEAPPSIEINVAQQTLMGFDGCNTIRAKLSKLGTADMELGPLMSTRKMCSDMTIPNRFGAALSRVKTYRREGLQLALSDGSGEPLILLRKTD